MARDSLIQDMTGSIMIMSKVVENAADINTPVKQLSKAQSIELQFSLDKDFDPQRIRRKLGQETNNNTRKSMKLSNKNSLKKHRPLQKQSSSMVDPPEIKDYLSGLRRTPMKDPIPEAQEHSEMQSYQFSKKDTVITSEMNISPQKNDNPFIKTTQLDDSSTPKANSGASRKMQPDPFKQYIDDFVEKSTPT